MSNVPFGAETGDAPWNQPDACIWPRCAYCGIEAVREYPDQSDEGVALPCSDAQKNDFCSRNCAIEFSLTSRRRRDTPASGGDSTALRGELTELYEAATVLANVSDAILRVVEGSDEGQGLIEIPRESYQDRLAGSGRFVELKSLRGMANELCKLLGGEDDDPKWLCGDCESGAAEEWLEALVAFRTRHFANEVWPYARDLTRTQIAGLHGFYMAHCGSEARDKAQTCAGGEVRLDNHHAATAGATGHQAKEQFAE